MKVCEFEGQRTSIYALVGRRERERERDRERVRGRTSEMYWPVSLERVGIGMRDWYHRDQRQNVSRIG